MSKKIRLQNRKVFVDTSAWFSIMHSNDKYHYKIDDKYQQLLDNCNKLITTNMIVGETYTLMRNRLKLNSTIPYDFLDMIKMSRVIKTVVTNKNIESEAIKILRKYNDHKFSYVDAVSFAFMNRMGIKHSLTLDIHFEIAGYHML
ncbi:MAG: type II toxin-antitoxin system VapC family toxin [Halanaerobiaceae bacterium]